MRPQQLTLPSRQSLLHGTTENHKPERVQIIISTAVVLEPQNSVARTCIARVLYQVLGEFIPMPREIPGCSVQAFLQSSCRDRKSTRLNSSHLGISYAVFCL